MASNPARLGHYKFCTKEKNHSFWSARFGWQYVQDWLNKGNVVGIVRVVPFNEGDAKNEFNETDLKIIIPAATMEQLLKLKNAPNNGEYIDFNQPSYTEQEKWCAMLDIPLP